MSQWLDAIMVWVQQNPGWAGIVIALTAFLESLAIVGIVVPGALILFGIGALVGLGAISLTEAWFWSSMGAIIGDGLSFWLGRHYQERLFTIWPFSRFEQLIHKGQKYFREHGGKSIFVGRFVGPIRPVVPLIAGMMNMPIKFYVPINIIAGILWSPAYILPGVVLGASLDLAATVAWRLVTVMALFGGTVWLLTWLFRRSYSILTPRVSMLLDHMLDWCHRHPHIGPVIAPIIDPKLPQKRSLFAMALLLIGATWGFISILVPAVFGQLPFAIDQQLYQSIQGIRHPYADLVLYWLAQFMNLAVLLPLLGVLLVFLTLRNRHITALNLLGACSIAFVFSLLLKLTISIPATNLALINSGSYPSLEIMLGTVCYGFIGAMLAGELAQQHRKWAYSLFFTIIISSAGARLYLGQHWPSDVISAWTFGGIWLGVISIAYRRHPHPSLNIPLLSLIISGTIAAGFAYQAVSVDTQAQLAKLQPLKVMHNSSLQQWRNSPNSALLPSTTGYDRTINLQISAPLADIEESLAIEGWSTATAVSWESLLLTLSPEAEPLKLPIIKSTLKDQLPVGQWIIKKDQQWLLLHLWASQLEVDEIGPVWLAQIETIDLKQHMYFLRLLTSSEISIQEERCLFNNWTCQKTSDHVLTYP